MWYAWTAFCYILSTKHITESAHVFSGVVVPSAIYQQGFSNGWIFNVSCASCDIHKYSVHGENLANMNMYTLVLHSTCYQPAIQPALCVVTPRSSSCVHVSLMQAMDKFLCRRLHILLCLPLFLLLLSFQNQVSYMHSTFLALVCTLQILYSGSFIN